MALRYRTNRAGSVGVLPSAEDTPRDPSCGCPVPQRAPAGVPPDAPVTPVDPHPASTGGFSRLPTMEPIVAPTQPGRTAPCVTRVRDRFWLRPTPTFDRRGPIYPEGTAIRVVQATEFVRGAFRLYRVEVLGRRTSAAGDPTDPVVCIVTVRSRFWLRPTAVFEHGPESPEFPVGTAVAILYTTLQHRGSLTLYRVRVNGREGYAALDENDMASCHSSSPVDPSVNAVLATGFAALTLADVASCSGLSGIDILRSYGKNFDGKA